MKLAGVVILYHPDDSVIMNISTYIEELDVLYVLDNSEIPAEAIASKIKEFPNAHYVAFRDNMGISYALNYALKQCTELSFLLTMDQDSRFLEGGLAEYKKKIAAMNQIGVAAYTCQYTSLGNIFPKATESHPVLRTITSGMILNVKIAASLGGFNEALFIDGVDHEFCYRVTRSRYKIWLICGVLLFHSIGAPSYHRFFGEKIISDNHPAIRRYYMMRNNIFLWKKYKENKDIFINDGIKGTIKAVLLEKDKCAKCRAALWGIWDGLFENMGKCKRRI